MVKMKKLVAGWAFWPTVLTVLFVTVYIAKAAQAAGPQPVPVAIVNTTPSSTNDIDAEVSVATSATSVAAISNGRQAVYIQNLSVVTVCCAKVNTVTCGATPANAGTVLKASAVAADGTGGTWSLSQFSGAIYCISTTGTAIVAVSAFTR